MSERAPNESQPGLKEALIQVGVSPEAARNPKEAVAGLIASAREVSVILSGLKEKKRTLELELVALKRDAAEMKINEIRALERLVAEVTRDQDETHASLAELYLILEGVPKE
ncbi:MAG: hypothetical protein FGM57_00675 [Candidatus Taylorbacteria bacterium]|nr:hypothetical protein [Candidatus Taylorbacteria bacterium]